MILNQEKEVVVKDAPPVRFVEVENHNAGMPEWFADRISIDVIHDGAYIPAKFMVDAQGKPVDPDILHKYYVLERDWGANFVAERVASRIGVPGYLTVQTARVLMDFGRFPGSSKDDATHLGRHAINQPYNDWLNFQQKRAVLEEHYDSISDSFDELLQGKILKVAIHTYDQYNESGTERPHVQLVTRMLSYQMEARMPADIFDPIYPDVLADYTVDRVLVSRLSLNLEKEHIAVGNNYPYLLPEGAMEVRHQVWRFFEWLHKRFTLDFPDTSTDPAYKSVWKMLKDTNFRSAESAALRSIVHLYRRAHTNKASLYSRALDAYHHIRCHLDEHPELIQAYRFDPMRCMSLGIEVRKDLLWTFDANGNPLEPRFDQVNRIGDLIGDALIEYITVDRAEMNKNPEALAIHHQKPFDKMS